MNAAQAAALLAMSARYCDGAAHAAQAKAADAIAAEADRLRHECLALIEADGESYRSVLAAYQLPKNTDQLRAARTAAIASALVTAAVPPTEVIAAAARLLELAHALLPLVSRSIAPDVAAAADAIRAAVSASRTNVEANLSGITDPGARSRLGSVIGGTEALEAEAGRVIAAVRASLTP